MKYYIVRITVFLFLIYNSLSCNHKGEPKSKLNLQFIFSQDSGFIDKQCLLYMFPNIDSLSFEYYDSDKYGKYYKKPATNNYVAIVFNPNEEQQTTTQLIEIDLSNNKIHEGECFSNWWYNPEDQILNFSVKEDYYYLPVCIGHGTGFGAMGFYLFQDISFINTPIYESVYSGNPIPEYRFLSMQDLHIHKDTIIIDYEIEDGIFEEINGVDSMRVISTKDWTINYYLKNNEWQATDSTLFESETLIFM